MEPHISLLFERLKFQLKTSNSIFQKFLAKVQKKSGQNFWLIPALAGLPLLLLLCRRSDHLRRRRRRRLRRRRRSEVGSKVKVELPDSTDRYLLRCKHFFVRTYLERIFVLKKLLLRKTSQNSLFYL